jgi:hypothetical protein
MAVPWRADGVLKLLILPLAPVEGPGCWMPASSAVRLRFAGCLPSEVLYSGVVESPARGRLPYAVAACSVSSSNCRNLDKVCINIVCIFFWHVFISGNQH